MQGHEETEQREMFDKYILLKAPIKKGRKIPAFSEGTKPLSRWNRASTGRLAMAIMGTAKSPVAKVMPAIHKGNRFSCWSVQKLKKTSVLLTIFWRVQKEIETKAAFLAVFCWSNVSIFQVLEEKILTN